MRVFILSVLVALGLGRLSAQDTSKAAKPAGGFRAEFLAQLKDVEEKIEGLADAMPAGKYGWRPMEGVRSVSEVFTHIAGANYLFPSMAGVKKPDNVAKDMEKTVTEKADVKKELSKSFDFVRAAIQNTSDADLDKPAKLFGEETTVRGVYFNAALHMHEHLGQSIAYARMNQIVPPWTAAEQAKNKK